MGKYIYRQTNRKDGNIGVRRNIKPAWKTKHRITRKLEQGDTHFVPVLKQGDRYFDLNLKCESRPFIFECEDRHYFKRGNRPFDSNLKRGDR